MGCYSSLTGTLAKSKYPFPQWDIAGKTSSDAPAILSGTTDRHCLPSGLGETRKMTLLEPMEKQKCLWSNMWHFRGCENTPGLWGGTSLWNASLLLAVSSCYHCASLQKAGEGSCTYTEPLLELSPWSYCAVCSIGLHQRQLCTKQRHPSPDSQGLLTRCATSSWGSAPGTA